jgi:hypothetical protein
MNPRWAGLPVCAARGLPVPFSSGTDADGRGQYGVNDHLPTLLCAAKGLCGICGEPLEDDAVFLVRDSRPMDLFALVFADPPNHEACAEQAMRMCPHIRDQGADAGRRGWLLIIAGSYSPGPPPEGSSGLVGFVPGDVVQIRVFAYSGGTLAEVTA